MNTLSWSSNQRFVVLNQSWRESQDIVVGKNINSDEIGLSRILLFAISPLLKEIFLDMCPCLSAQTSIVLPDFKIETLQCLKDLMNGTGNNLIKEPDLIELLRTLGISISTVSHKTDESSTPCLPEFLETKLKNLHLEKVSSSVQHQLSSNSSDIDMFLTDDESFISSPSVKKVDEEVITKKENSAKIGLSLSKLDSSLDSSKQHMDKTVFEDAIENISDNNDVSEIKTVKNFTELVEEEKESLEEVNCGKTNREETDNLKSSHLDTAVDRSGRDNEIQISVDAGIQVNQADHDDGESLEESCSEEEEDCSEEEESDEDDTEGDQEESESDPSWEADVDHSSEDDEEDFVDTERRKKLEKSAAKNLSHVQSSNLSMMEKSSLSFYMSDCGPIHINTRCGCKGSCLRNCACKTAKVECSQWCSCDNFKCKSKIDQRHGKLNTTDNKANIDSKHEDGAVGGLDAETSEEILTRTPETLPPPLSCSTVELSMTARRRKKLFTEKLGPQEFE